MEENENSSSEIICVEVQENENGEIIYVEKIENNDYMVMDDDFCVVECEIATSGETSSSSEVKKNSTETKETDPVEVIFLSNIDEDVDEPIIVKQEIDETEHLSDDSSDDSDIVASAFKTLKTYVRKHSNFVKIEPVIGNKFMKLQKPIKSFTPTKSPQAHKLNALLQVASGKVNQISKTRLPGAAGNKHMASEIIPVRHQNSFGHQRPKLWSHRVDRKNFDKTNLISSLNTTSQDTVSQEKHIFLKSEDSNEPDFRVNSIETKPGVKRKMKDLPYQCDMCEKSFRQATSLVIHLKVHAGKYTDNCVIS
ncbi:hypothetical protein L9F63_024223 [Diploptera punctata]|uniref:C2H2-type domain-containing protein n=1 Tax=Diploptera punctata TaxID=6984 RepID=A0AAD7ZHF8_DIPPU|nr:hypothetical protein L9F63_024223 [Diploptera punctata]